MATISSLGIGSGLDANGIISKLVDLEKQPLQGLKARANSIQARISAFGAIQSQFSALNDVMQRISSSGVWQGTSAASSNTSAATISATSTAQPASFSLDVDVLANAQTVSSAGFAPGATVGAGAMTLQLGSWSPGGTAFTPAAGSAVTSITISATDTVTDVATKINAAHGGVTATVFNDGTSNHLLLKSNNTGVVNGFRIQVADANGNNTNNAGLSRLAFDPATLNPATNSTFGMATTGLPVQYGVDAKARINGLAVTSSSNTLTNNFQGVTINLLATTTTNYGTPGEVRVPVNMSVSNDTSGAVKNVQDFVTAFNTLRQSLKDMTKYDAATQTAGPFQGDSVIVGLGNILSKMVTSISDAAGVYHRLSDVGVSVQRDGTLAINSVKLGAAANNGTALQQLFTATAPNPLNAGFALKFAQFTQGALYSTGMISNEAKALQQELTDNSQRQADVNKKAASIQARLTQQYSALDAKMGKLSALNAYVAQQITLWNKPSN